jgi:succinate dehydrogenase / fumarate reductase, iron-sulfur subunit
MITEMKYISVACSRFDPGVDRAPYQITYKVPFSPGQSVLNVLTYIYENIDPGLGFYSNCDRGICGRCTMTINGQSAAACTTLVDGDLILAPLRGRRQIRDLIVDL